MNIKPINSQSVPKPDFAQKKDDNILPKKVSLVLPISLMACPIVGLIVLYLIINFFIPSATSVGDSQDGLFGASGMFTTIANTGLFILGAPIALICFIVGLKLYSKKRSIRDGQK